ncbi:ATPase, T2SS/T4P/T4SS family [Pseudomonas syringae pv. actinidiae]|nr:ATPase, T2SS/T4P/T4SS family [Pseudomonas syringae pv. actinidiae]
MSIIVLKKRAKRLREVVGTMFNVTVTHSQALEMVAKAEGHSNWDTACAVENARSRDTGAPTESVPADTANSDYSITEEQISELVKLNQKYLNQNIAEFFSREDDAHKNTASADIFDIHTYPNSPKDISSLMATQPGCLERMLDVINNPHGGLLVVGGKPGNGKTTTVHAIIDDMARRNAEPIEIYHVGIQEFDYPESINVVMCNELSDTLSTEGFGQGSLVFLDEIRTAQSASLAIDLAMMGITIVTTMHAVSGTQIVERLRALARSSKSPHNLESLLQSGKFFGAYQRLDWPAMKPQG